MPTLVSLLAATASGSAQIDAAEIDLKRAGERTRELVVNVRTLDDGAEDSVCFWCRRCNGSPKKPAAKTISFARRRSLAGAAASHCQQPADHRERPDAERAAGSVRRNARSSQAGASPHRFGRRRATSSDLVQPAPGDLRPYLAQLCQSLGASMIPDHARLR